MKMKRVLLSAVASTAVLSMSLTCFAQNIQISSGVSSGNSIPIEIPQSSSGIAASGINGLKPWENLTYKGGMEAYLKILNQTGLTVSSSAVSRVLSQPVAIEGYIIGIPYVPPVTNPEPKSEEPAKQEPKAAEPELEPEPEPEPEPEGGQEEEKIDGLSSADMLSITTDVPAMLKFAVSTREESKVVKYVLNSQSAQLGDAIKNRNEAILKLDDKSIEKTGIEAVKKMMPNLLKADKVQVTNVEYVSANQAIASVSIPVYATYSTMSDDLKAKLPKDYDTSAIGSIDKILSNPLSAKDSMDKTLFEAGMDFFGEFQKACGAVDLYTQYPAAYETGTMQIKMTKEDGAWHADMESLVINVSIDGNATSIKLLS